MLSFTGFAFTVVLLINFEVEGTRAVARQHDRLGLGLAEHPS